MKPWDDIWEAFDKLSDDLHQLQNDVDDHLQRIDDALAEMQLRIIKLEEKAEAATTIRIVGLEKEVNE